jgi:uncharacterized membrane protein
LSWTTFIWVVVFLVFVVVLRDIFTDLFRATELSGWQKPVWVILLVFMPCLTALVFVIARTVGGGPGG